jgi:NADH-quinone oxidoreductase subunit M
LLLKIGGYGILRIAYPIFPHAAVSMSDLVATIAVVSILYGGLNALASKDLKRMIAYSSVSHMGFVLLGIASLTALSITGAVYEMVSHGLISAFLFIVAGVLSDRTHDRTINNYSGLSGKMPVYFSMVLISFFAAMGLPGFSGFMAEVMVLFGAFQSGGTNGLVAHGFAFVAVGGLILGAAYFLWTLQRMFFGPFHYRGTGESLALTDLSTREYLMMVPLAALILLLGVLPQPLLNYINPFSGNFVNHILEQVVGQGL